MLDLISDYPLETSRAGPALSVDPEEMASFNEFAGITGSEVRLLPSATSFAFDPGAMLAALDVMTEYPVSAPSKPKPKELRSKARSAGENLVLWLSGQRGVFSETGETPWSDQTEAVVELAAHHYRGRDLAAFLVGATRQLRAGKAGQLPEVLASGFCVLASLPRASVRAALRGVDLSQTCDAGCRFGGQLVPRSAIAARQALGV